MQRIRVVTVALALVAAGLGVIGPVGAAPVPYGDLVRLEGDTPREAAIAISQGLFPDGQVDAAVLARQDTFPDALGASALTADVGGPLLLTDGDQLSEDTEEELVRVLREDGTVHLLGGENALAPAVAARLLELGFRTPRFPGRDRIETAALVARFTGAGDDRTVVLARAFGDPDLEQGWVDSVSCGGWAAATGTPVLLTRSDEAGVAHDTLVAMEALGVRRVEVCGGQAAVPDSQLEQLRGYGVEVARHAGDDRAQTAVAVATGLWGLPDRSDRVFLLVPGYGTDFGYGLVAAPLSARLRAPILLTGGDQPTACDDEQRAAATLCHLATGDRRAGGLVVVGPPSVLSDDVMLAAAEAAALPRDREPPTVPANVTVADRPEDAGDALEVSWDPSVDTAAGVAYRVHVTPAEGDPLSPVDTDDTSVVVQGLEAGTTYTIAVTASDVFGNTSAASSGVTGTPTDEVPAAPTAFREVAVDGAEVTVSWFPAPEADVDGYVVQRIGVPVLTPSDCDPGVLIPHDWQTIATVDAGTTSVVDTPGGEACYRYAVVDTTENRSPFSGPFGPVSPS